MYGKCFGQVRHEDHQVIRIHRIVESKSSGSQDTFPNKVNWIFLKHFLVIFLFRSDWDSFFRENKDMNEMKPGERPDTIHIENLPCKWFVNYQDKSGLAHDKPSDYVLKKAFSTFGDIKVVDIPMLDPYRHKMKKSVSGLKTFSFGQDLVFEAYIQYKVSLKEASQNTKG